MSSCKIGDIETQVISNTLSTNNTLSELYLGGNLITDIGTYALAHALQTNTALTTLDLSENKIETNGIQFVNSFTYLNNTLTTLKLYCNGNIFRHQSTIIPNSSAIQDSEESSRQRQNNSQMEIVVSLFNDPKSTMSMLNGDRYLLQEIIRYAKVPPLNVMLCYVTIFKK